MLAVSATMRLRNSSGSRAGADTDPADANTAFTEGVS